MLKPPYPYFGGKSRIMPQIWQRFGIVQNFVDPFFGSGAPLLSRPKHLAPKPEKPMPACFGVETVNDKDGLLCNFWRSVKHDPESVAWHADYPVSEIDLHSRHAYLIDHREAVETLLADPDAFDARLAGWWVWGISAWIGDGWGYVKDKRLPRLSEHGNGILSKQIQPKVYINQLSQRLQHVRITCGEWHRILGPSVTTRHGLTAMMLDPPYALADHTVDYGNNTDIFHEVQQWAIENGNNPLLRIALCGYDFDMPEGWQPLKWRANGGYANQGHGRGRENAKREMVWFSPHCLHAETQARLFEV